MRTNLLALVLAVLPAATLANGYSVPNVNPRDLGLSGSAVAAQRDAAAVYADPAALATLAEGPHLALAIPALDIHAQWNAPTGPSDSATQFKPVPPGGVFAAYGATIRGYRTGFGAGVNVPFGGNVYWDTDWPGRFRVTTVDRKVYAFYLNGAVEPVPYLRVGAGFLYYETTEYLRQGMDYLGSEGYAEVSAKGGAPSFQLAMDVQPIEAVRVTFDYKHKATQHLEGDAAFHGVPPSIRPSLPDQSVKHALTMPNELNAAASWRARNDILVTVGYTFERWVVYQEDRFVGSAGTEVLVPRNYGNGHTFRGGVEYELLPAIELRAGLLRDVSGGPSSTFSPSLPDASSWAGSVGATWRVRPALTLDAAFFMAVMDRVTATGSAFPGNYDMRAEILSVGVTWRPMAR